jgi:hypothetical protein
MTNRQIAQQLHAYIKHRASYEGVGYELDPSFFLGYMRLGITQFYGAVIGPEGIVSDDQEPVPGFLAGFLKDRDKTSGD